MTREEAVADIKQCLEDNKWGCGKYTEAFCWAMYALNEEFVIEEIMAEIEDAKYLACGQLKGTKNYMAEGLDKALSIIDKHISGKENE